MEVKIDIGRAIDIGQNENKQNQEDFILYQVVSGEPPKALFILNDGIGGENAGEIASMLGAYSMMNELLLGLCLEDDPGFKTVESKIKTALNNAHTKIFEKAKLEKYKDMGTTSTVLYLNDRKAYWSWCGDSRIYRLSEEGLERLTADHDQFETSIEVGIYQESDKFTELRGLMGQFAITQSLGHPDLKDSAKPKMLNLSVQGEELEAGKFLYIFCSDGLHTVLPDSIQEIPSAEDDEEAENQDQDWEYEKGILEICWPYIDNEENQNFSAQDMADALLEEALRLKAQDNVSIICLGLEVSEQDEEEEVETEDDTERKLIKLI